MKQLYAFLTALISLPTLAIVPNSAWNPENAPTATTGFEENKGQVIHSDGTPATDVRFRMSQGNTRIFLLNDGIAFQFQRMHLPDGYAELLAHEADELEADARIEALSKDIRIETFRMDMHLEGADPAARISMGEPSTDIIHYYTHNALNVHRYSEVTYHDVYPGIDWVLRTTAQGMKYDFVIHPGADPDVIRLVFTDQEELYVDDQGRLVHANRMGRFLEEAPVSFQDGRTVDTRFILDGSTLRFELDGYDKTRPLTIDPDRIWGTYYGGDSNDYGRATVEDPDGNLYLAGTSWSAEVIASGGHQMTSGGNMDAMLVKFTADGTRLWATYYGGGLVDYGYGCDVDADGNVFLAGFTRSPDNIGMDGHQNSIGGAGTSNTDGFLVKFNAAGERLWGTYYGGTEYDNLFVCKVDADGNVYGAGSTASSFVIATEGGQQFVGGDRDAFIVKFAPDGTRLWGRYVGGEFTDAGFDCAVDATGNVYLCGMASSPNLIASNGYQNDLSGGNDGFLVKFAADGTRLWGTYYGGTEDDWAFCCAVDGNDDVYITGATWSDAGIADGGHQNTYMGGSGYYGDALLVKFSPDGTRLWGTYYGGDDDDVAFSCTTDASDHVYIAGVTLSSMGIAVNGFQNEPGGGPSDQDGFLAMLDGSGTRIWGTYYGGSDYSGLGCAVAGNGDVLLAGTTRSNNASSIAENGFQNANGGGWCDAFLVRFDGVNTGIADPAASGPCLRWLGQQGSIHTVSLGTHRSSFDLLDGAGRVVRFFPASTQESLELDLGDLAPGTYTLRSRTDVGPKVLRLVHQ
ncbi:MAG TPA: hypothetical protein PLV08_02725 [Flavobacteriales bacterium]|jgi:hypothetical protein|nr:hypothetical protein [Flavobacteriales bacterium]MBP9176632.1 hypothetical protein [Flavobacteriales bacterium]MCC6911506.1 hypothetical protein [Flavobacteriales bacterium]HQW06897.1 hypothetical protein [Flavobacteriales bacterium]HQX00043.1 hypothetical protein [Flavobacteriales bacterium]